MRILDIQAENVTGMSFSSDSRKLLVLGVSFGDLISATVLDVATGTEISYIRLKGQPDSVKFSDDGKNIIVQYGQPRVAYDENGNKVQMIEGDH